MVAQSLRMASGNEYSMGSASQDPFSSRLSAALEASRPRSRMVRPPSARILEPDAGPDEYESRLETAMNEAIQKRRSSGLDESSDEPGVAADPDDYDDAPATEHSPDLQTVIDAWPTLDPAVTASILAMATAG